MSGHWYVEADWGGIRPALKQVDEGSFYVEAGWWGITIMLKKIDKLQVKWWRRLKNGHSNVEADCWVNSFRLKRTDEGQRYVKARWCGAVQCGVSFKLKMRGQSFVKADLCMVCLMLKRIDERSVLCWSRIIRSHSYVEAEWKNLSVMLKLNDVWSVLWWSRFVIDNFYIKAELWGVSFMLK